MPLGSAPPRSGSSGNSVQWVWGEREQGAERRQGAQGSHAINETDSFIDIWTVRLTKVNPRPSLASSQSHEQDENMDLCQGYHSGRLDTLLFHPYRYRYVGRK
ncbi:hypothetical protein RRG08_048454 [Elysia crispata]|uniref:Uncharacterized protein n=1 Tax=Elysia crispata TaxID=231223 RepID=A0AAE1BAY0_9GAST|nr:hypothetical protein RRG08_048454 [Elysia crispata]